MTIIQVSIWAKLLERSHKAVSESQSLFLGCICFSHSFVLRMLFKFFQLLQGNANPLKEHLSFQDLNFSIVLTKILISLLRKWPCFFKTKQVWRSIYFLLHNPYCFLLRTMCVFMRRQYCSYFQLCVIQVFSKAQQCRGLLKELLFCDVDVSLKMWAIYLTDH